MSTFCHIELLELIKFVYREEEPADQEVPRHLKY